MEEKEDGVDKKMRVIVRMRPLLDREEGDSIDGLIVNKET
jgi:hypothetical protein